MRTMSSNSHRKTVNSRGQQLKALFRLRLGTSRRDLRLILLLLDNLIGSNRASWDETNSNVAKMCEIPSSTFYRWIKALKELGLIRVADIPGSHRKRWEIVWGNVYKLAALAKDGSRLEEADEIISDASNEFSPGESHHSGGEDGVSQRESALSHREHTTSSLNTTLPTPPPRSAWEGVVGDLYARGVRHPVSCIDKAESNGSSVGDVQAVIEYYDAQGKSFGAGALMKAVSRCRPGFPPEHLGWPKPLANPGSAHDSEVVAQARKLHADEKQRQQKEIEYLEANYGSTLDKMTEDDLLCLARGNEIITSRLRQKGLTSEIRLRLLRLLEKQQAASELRRIPDRESLEDEQAG